MNLIFEGISDCIEGAIGMYTGKFSWKEWAVAKSVSLAISIACFGFGKAFKWIKSIKSGVAASNVAKNVAARGAAAFAKEGARKSLVQALKYTAKTAAIQGAAYLANEALDLAIQEYCKAALGRLKADLKSFAQGQDSIKESLLLAWYQLKLNGQDVDLNENIMHSNDKEFQAILQSILVQTFKNSENDHKGWHEFCKVFQKVIGPAHQVADKTVFKKRPVAGLVAKTVVGSTLAAVDAILTGKELETVKQHLSNKISSGVKDRFKVQKGIQELKGFKEFCQNQAISKIVQEQQSKLAENFSETFVQKFVLAYKGVVGSIVKPMANHGVNKVMSKVTMSYKQEGYFKEKRKQHQQFYNVAPTIGEKNLKMTRDQVIKDRLNSPNNELDIRGLQKKTGKKIVIETYEVDSNGKEKCIKSDSHGKGEEIRLKLTQRKKPDGTYKGHYELIDNKSGKVIPNNGDTYTCLQQAILQSEKPHLKSNPEQLATEAKQLKEKVLLDTESNLLRDLHQKHCSHIEEHGLGKYGLSGGGGKGSSYNPNRRLKHLDLDDSDYDPDYIGNKAFECYEEFYKKCVHVPGHGKGKEGGVGREDFTRFGITPNANTQYGMVEVTLANGDVKRFMHIYDGRISETFNNHLSNQGSTGKGGRDRREPPGLQSKIFEVDPATNRIIKDGINVAKHGKHSEVFLLNVSFEFPANFPRAFHFVTKVNKLLFLSLFECVFSQSFNLLIFSAYERSCW